MRKFHVVPAKMTPIADDLAPARHRSRNAGSRIEELQAIARTVASLRETLLDHSPMLAVCAEALEKAVVLEIESERCSAIVTANDDYAE